MKARFRVLSTSSIGAAGRVFAIKVERPVQTCHTARPAQSKATTAPARSTLVQPLRPVRPLRHRGTIFPPKYRGIILHSLHHSTGLPKGPWRAMALMPQGLLRATLRRLEAQC
jgi:hypothetical protein